MPADTPDMVLVPRTLTKEMIAEGLGMAPTAANLTASDLQILWTFMIRASPLGASGEGALRPASPDAVDRVMAILNYWFDGLGRVDRNSHMVKQLAALVAPNPPGEGEAPVAWRRFVIYWLDKGPVARAFVDDLNGYITGGSGRCLEALEAHGAMVFQKVADLSRPTPATPEGPREKVAHYGDPCIYCGIGHDDVPAGPCQGRGVFISRERAEALLDFCKRGAGPSGWPTPLWTEVQRFIAEINTALQHQAQGGE